MLYFIYGVNTRLLTKRQARQTLLLFTLVLVVLGIQAFFSTGSPDPAVAAQSTGDTLPTRTPTAHPSATSTPNPTFTVTPIPKIWIARLVSNTLGATQGQGSIFRVYVQGIHDTPIELRSENQLIAANSGSKPEYGPYAAEFAPVTKGTWTVSVPALGVSLDVVADNYNLAIIEFVQIPVPEATQTVITTATATPLGGTDWEGRIIGETAGAGVPFSRLLIRVVGRDNQPVRLSTVAQPINTANTGQKPDELGPNMVEFTGLTPGKYIIEPLGLNVSLDVELKPNIETQVEFRPQSPTPTSTPLATATNTPLLLPPTATPTSTDTPTPTDTATPTATALPTPTADTPAPSPTPVTRWIGAVESRTDSGIEASSITVQIAGIEGLPVRLDALQNDTFNEKRCLTGQGGVGQDACTFKELTPGQYIISPEGLDLSLPLNLFEHEAARVNFNIEVLPPGISGWQARLRNNTNGFQALPRTEGTIRVWVIGRAGQVVALRPARTPLVEQFCEVVHNPVLGGLICEFGQLGPGVYLVEAVNTGAKLQVFVDGIGKAEVEFSPNATSNTLASAPVVGQGAQPNQPTATATQMPLVLMPPTPTAMLTPTSTATPAFAWQGRIVESTYIGTGAIGVRAAGLKDHPVILHSGDWRTPPQLTGTKAELGQYATEFGGLAPGEYIIELVDLAELKVKLLPGEFMLVEFRYDFINLP